MRLRLFLAASLLALLSGCVTIGSNTGLLITPFGVIGAHSFAPPEPQSDTVAAAQNRPATRAGT
jgi:hypothetical protein